MCNLQKSFRHLLRSLTPGLAITEEDEEEAPCEDLFEEGFDPMSLLDEMGQQEQGPYEALIHSRDRDIALPSKVKLRAGGKGCFCFPEPLQCMLHGRLSPKCIHANALGMGWNGVVL